MEYDTLCLNCFAQRGAYEVCPYCGHVAGTPAKEPYLLAPGAKLWGRYIIGTVLGVGGFGVTYKAWDTRLGTIVAIKEFYPQGLVNRIPGEAKVRVFSGEKMETYHQQLARFIDEAKNLARFADEPQIVSVLDYFEDNGTAYIVMEFLDGMTLKQYIAESGGRLPQDAALAIEAGLLKGLAAIHRQGIIHRDISPDNVYILHDGSVKLLDFGAARFAAAEGSELSQGVVVKKGYAPPEQYRANMKQGTWTDIYAAGATLYKMLTGQTPEESIERSEHDRLTRVSQTGTAVDTAVDRAIMKAMALKPELRFKTADAMLAVLENRTVVDEPEVELKKRKRRGAVAVVASLVVLALAVVLVATTVSRGGGGVVFVAGGPSLADMDIQPDTITVVTLLNTQSTYGGPEAQRLQQLADAFMQKYPQHTVVVEPVYFNNGGDAYDAAKSEIAPRIASGDLAVFDLYLYDQLGDAKNYKAELTPLFNALEMDDYLLLGNWWKNVKTWDDPSVYSAHTQYEFFLGYGNAASAEAYGLTLPESFTSFEEILQLERAYPGAVDLEPYYARDAIEAMHPNLGEEDPERAARLMGEYAQMYKEGYFGNNIYNNEGKRLPQPYAADKPAIRIGTSGRWFAEEVTQNSGGAVSFIPLLADGKVLCALYGTWGVSNYVTENQKNLGMLFIHFMYSERGQEILYLQDEHEMPVNRAAMQTFAGVHGMDSLFTPAFMDSLELNMSTTVIPYEIVDLIREKGAGEEEVYNAVMAYWQERNSQ